MGGDWPDARHPGDEVRVPDNRTDVVMGTTLGRRTQDRESFLEDRTMLQNAGEAPHEWVSRMPLVKQAPVPVINSYRVSQKLEAAFESVMSSMAGGLAAQLVRDAREREYSLFVVGGAVRDLVLGRTDVNDLDMTGDVPSGLLRDLVYFSGIQLLPTDRSRLRRAWLPRVNISSSSVVHAYRLIPGAATSKDNQVTVHHFLEYAPFKEALISEGNDGFLFGWDAEADFRWRDMTINGLLYDPVKKVVVDPGGVLDDLGVTQRYLRDWDAALVNESKITLRPIAIPASAPAYWAPKAVARLVKSITKFPAASLAGTMPWVEQHRVLLRDLSPTLIDASATALDFHLMRAFDETRPGRDLLKRVEPALDLLAMAGAPSWFVLSVREAASGSAHLKPQGPSETVMWPRAGVGALRLQIDGGRCSVGADMPSPADADPGLAAWYFQALVAGWDANVVQVDELGPVVAYTDGKVTIAPVDSEGRVIPATPDDMPARTERPGTARPGSNVQESVVESGRSESKVRANPDPAERNASVDAGLSGGVLSADGMLAARVVPGGIEFRDSSAATPGLIPITTEGFSVLAVDGAVGASRALVSVARGTALVHESDASRDRALVRTPSARGVLLPDRGILVDAEGAALLVRLEQPQQTKPVEWLVGCRVSDLDSAMFGGEFLVVAGCAVDGNYELRGARGTPDNWRLLSTLRLDSRADRVSLARSTDSVRVAVVLGEKSVGYSLENDEWRAE